MSTYDLCGNHSKDELMPLLSEYQIDEITHLCIQYAKWANDTKSHLVSDIKIK